MTDDLIFTLAWQSWPVAALFALLGWTLRDDRPGQAFGLAGLALLLNVPMSAWATVDTIGRQRAGRADGAGWEVALAILWTASLPTLASGALLAVLIRRRRRGESGSRETDSAPPAGRG